MFFSTFTGIALLFAAFTMFAMDVPSFHVVPISREKGRGFGSPPVQL